MQPSSPGGCTPAARKRRPRAAGRTLHQRLPTPSPWWWLQISAIQKRQFPDNSNLGAENGLKNGTSLPSAMDSLPFLTQFRICLRPYVLENERLVLDYEIK
jgi:hypothetical protein